LGSVCILACPRLAADYSGRDAILNAARESLSRDASECFLGPPVDRLIRTGGELRLRDSSCGNAPARADLFAPHVARLQQVVAAM
jgi:undecaprenyl pyrophosphate synthase